jgi:hypothetical protein
MTPTTTTSSWFAPCDTVPADASLDELTALHDHTVQAAIAHLDTCAECRTSTNACQDADLLSDILEDLNARVAAAERQQAGAAEFAQAA